MAELKAQLKSAPINYSDDNNIAGKYFESLLTDLQDKHLIDTFDIDNIKLKLRSKLLTFNEIINSLELIKTEGRSKARTVDGQIINDTQYNELPNEFYSPLGDKLAGEWENDYTLLNTNKWRVPMPRPPVCINTSPCKVCPKDSSTYPVNLKEWDNSRHVTQPAINTKWAEDQNQS